MLSEFYSNLCVANKVIIINKSVYKRKRMAKVLHKGFCYT